MSRPDFVDTRDADFDSLAEYFDPPMLASCLGKRPQK
jgi:hypothetical protein